MKRNKLDKAAASKAWADRFNNRVAAKPREPHAVKVRAAAGKPDTTEILLYDEIGYFGVTAKEFVTALATITTPKITVRINSPGGDVFDGLAIYNAIKSAKQEINCVVDGIAASAASFIALAGATVTIHASAMLMVHRAWGLAIGNQADMADMATTLGKIDGQLADIYAAQTGKAAADMMAMMTGESDGTWFTADEAAALGLVDEVLRAESEGVDDPAGFDPCCDPNDPAYDPADPNCDCTEEEKARAKATVQMKTMRRRLALEAHE